MATYKKFSELPQIVEASENTKVPVLDNGEMKLLDGSKLGGDTGIKTAIIKSSDYDEMLVNLQSASAAETLATVAATYSCLNMTFEEAYETMANGEPLEIVFMVVAEGCVVDHGVASFAGVAMTGSPCLILFLDTTGLELYWTADGLFPEGK